jgi:hypothetical protein
VKGAAAAVIPWDPTAPTVAEAVVEGGESVAAMAGLELKVRAPAVASFAPAEAV